MDNVVDVLPHPHQAETQGFAVRRALPIFFAALVCAATMWNTVDINFYGDNESIALDWPVVLKLILAAFCTMAGLFGVLFDARIRGTLLFGPGLLLSLLAIVFVTTSVVALPEVANVCRAAALLYVGYLLFIPTALSVLGLRTIIIACLCGMIVNLLACWGLFLFFPELGVFQEQLGNEVMSSRMGGLGHPNAIGRIAVLTGLLGLAILRSRQLCPKWPGGRALLVGVMVLGLVSALATFSRTAIVAGVIAIVFLMLDRISTREGMTLVLAAFFCVVVGLLGFELVSGGGGLADSLLSATTKTGEIEELTSATGRTAIWAESIRLIFERPVTGWGLNSAPVLLEDFSRHTHNLVLHATFSGGFLAGLLVVCLLAWNFFFGLGSEEPLVRAVSMYVLVSGLFEDTVLDTFASPSTILWLLVLLHPAMVALSKQEPIESDAETAYTEAVPT
ncbi:MAG: O-antigen ligase family protein [Rubripirellula sp.]